ncbi:MAG: YihY family inner membrane protein [Halieaceae bacterium]|nr:YihY family inner membrane protein [Halieaceae bacterium]
MDFNRQQLHHVWHRMLYLFSRFRTDRCSENAAALTYMSLFALVPLLTVMYTMASAVPAFGGLEDKMQAFLFENLMPDSNSEIQSYLSDFSRQAKNLTGFGIGVLVITAILMLRNIERAFNMIWRARENRSPVASFLLYWAVLSLAPLTIGLALGISTYLQSFAIMFEDFDLIGAGSLMLKASPLLLSMAGFTLIYVAVPNCRVPFRHAAIGGFTTAIAFNIARSLFTKLVVGSSYTFIYGAFAAVPLFLLWIYLSWNIVLMGGVLVHSLSAYQSREQASRPTLLKALDVLYLFHQKQKSGATVREIELINGSYETIKNLDSETWRELRDTLLEHKLISLDERGHYLLSRDLHNITFWQLKEWVNAELPLDAVAVANPLNWQDEAYQMLRGQRSQQRQILSITLAELFDR